MDKTSQGTLELLEENTIWWQEAAVACENIALHLPSGKKEEWLLMCAVYRERAGIVGRFVAQLRQGGNRLSLRERLPQPHSSW